MAGSEDGVLGPDDLDRLQMVTNGEEFGAENIEFALNSFDVKTIKKQVVKRKCSQMNPNSRVIKRTLTTRRLNQVLRRNHKGSRFNYIQL